MGVYIYRFFNDFLLDEPTPEQIATFGPDAEMRAWLDAVLQRRENGTITPTEQQGLAEYERIQHIILLFKIGDLPYLNSMT
ncbi:MAG: hypothetical protein HC837_07040 [Chloroflexaceae bacterium]|nr:hypothetical protein [Chloroflexaceae bacterium]